MKYISVLICGNIWLSIFYTKYIVKCTFSLPPPFYLTFSSILIGWNLIACWHRPITSFTVDLVQYGHLVPVNFILFYFFSHIQFSWVSLFAYNTISKIRDDLSNLVLSNNSKLKIHLVSAAVGPSSSRPCTTRGGFAKKKEPFQYP